MSLNGRILQVVADYQADTHHLTLNGNIIASHPNGYSCHCLAQRIIKGDASRVKQQAEYIIRCGGSCDLDAVSQAARTI